MRNLLKSMARFSWSLSLFGARSMARTLAPGGQGRALSRDMDTVTSAVTQQLGEGLAQVFETGQRIQERIVDTAFDVVSGTASAPRAGAIDPRRLVVLGEALAAGTGDFNISARSQEGSFAAHVARQIGATFSQPLFQTPGLTALQAFGSQPAIVPDLLQTTVRTQLPREPEQLSNLSVPGMTVAGSLTARPRAPLVCRDDVTQTLINLTLGLPELLHSESPGPTQVERARSLAPTLAIVALGYHEAVSAAVAGDPSLLPSPRDFADAYGRVLSELACAQIVALNIPDPLTTAYFSDVHTAARILKTESGFLNDKYNLGPDDRLTLPGLYEIGYQFMDRRLHELPDGSVVTGTVAARLSEGLQTLNAAIASEAARRKATVCNLHGFFHRVEREGLAAGGKRLNAEYLGGFYLLNGLYPGPTGQALIANEILTTLNSLSGGTYPLVDAAIVAASDATTMMALAPGPCSTDEFLRPWPSDALMPFPPLAPGLSETPIQTTYPGLETGKEACIPALGVPAGGYANPERTTPLRLPEGLEQTLDLDPLGSHLTDALRVVDCPGEQPLIPGFPAFGVCGDVFFGGPTLTTSHLRGKVQIRFSPPDGNNVSRFEVRHPGGLVGTVGELAAPQLFRMPAHLTRLEDLPELVSSGELDLTSGAVTNLHYNLRNINTALRTLINVNPTHPLPHLALMYPGAPNGGSSWARFDPRPDGKLDFTFAGNLFVPLGVEAGGEPIRFALPFTTPDLQAASFLARGTSLHPQLCVTTRAPETAAADPPALPERAVQEWTPFVHNSSFGDVFHLGIPELGGPATGRSHLMGRVRVQFGAMTEGTLPVLFQVLPPGGLLSNDPSPPPFLPPGTSRGMIGFDEIMRFPEVHYDQFALACADDPFNLALGNVNLRTGRLTSPLLLRGFVSQALFANLVRVEPCTPASSFNYQGPAAFESGPRGETIFRFDGTVYLPYPVGFRFPSPTPDGRPPYVVVEPSRLDPFRRIQAMHVSQRHDGVLSGAADAISSLGERFSYRYSIPAGGSGATFEYSNHAKRATFRLRSLAWLSHGWSRGSTSTVPDVLTFGGFGTWSEDKDTHQVSVHLSTAPGAPYVGILVDGGRTSNANTKPKHIEETLP